MNKFWIEKSDLIQHLFNRNHRMMERLSEKHFKLREWIIWDEKIDMERFWIEHEFVD